MTDPGLVMSDPEKVVCKELTIVTCRKTAAKTCEFDCDKKRLDYLKDNDNITVHRRARHM